MGLIREFKEFAFKGSMIDMAVGLIIGAGFGAVVAALVNNIVKPPIDYLVAKGQEVNPVGLKQQIGETLKGPDGKDVQFFIDWGAFINAIISFLIVALVVFLLLKAINTARRKFEKEKAAEPTVLPEDVALLREIRDLLAKQR